MMMLMAMLIAVGADMYHIAAAAAVTLLLSQDGSREDETDADDDAYGDADCCWC